MKYKLIIWIIGIVLLLNLIQALEVNQEVSVTVLSGKINVFSPINDDVYYNRMISINLTMTDKVLFRYAKYSDNGDPLVTLCRKCNQYGYDTIKTKPFNDGFHRVTLLAVFDTGEITEYVDLIVDTLKPMIKQTSPGKGFTNGNFEVKFQEANPKEIWLNYGNELTGYKTQAVDMNNCSKHKNTDKYTICKVSVDLSAYDKQEIEYWFNVSDIADRSDESNPVKLIVDTSAPIVNNPEFFWLQGVGKQNKNIHFYIDVSEDNFNEISYIDLSDGKSKEKKLCSKIEAGLCEKIVSFSKGSHTVDIMISDKAGNSVSEEIEFEVI